MDKDKIQCIMDVVVVCQRQAIDVAYIISLEECEESDTYRKIAGGIFVILASRLSIPLEAEVGRLDRGSSFSKFDQPTTFASRLRDQIIELESSKIRCERYIIALLKDSKSRLIAVQESLGEEERKWIEGPLKLFNEDIRKFIYDEYSGNFGSFIM